MASCPLLPTTPYLTWRNWGIVVSTACIFWPPICFLVFCNLVSILSPAFLLFVVPSAVSNPHGMALTGSSFPLDQSVPWVTVFPLCLLFFHLFSWGTPLLLSSTLPHFILFTSLPSVSLISHLGPSHAPRLQLLPPRTSQHVSPLPYLTHLPLTAGRSFCPPCAQAPQPSLPLLGLCCLAECPSHRSLTSALPFLKLSSWGKFGSLFRSVPLLLTAADLSWES